MKKKGSKHQTPAEIKRAKPKSLKIAEIQALKETGYSYRQISKMTGASFSTIAKYLRMSGKEVEQIKTYVKRKQLVDDFVIAEKTRSFIDEQIPKAQFRELVGLWKIARELQAQRNTAGSNTQVNIVINSDKDKGVVEVVEDLKENKDA